MWLPENCKGKLNSTSGREDLQEIASNARKLFIKSGDINRQESVPILEAKNLKSASYGRQFYALLMIRSNQQVCFTQKYSLEKDKNLRRPENVLGTF